MYKRFDMNKNTLAHHITTVTSEKEARFLIDEFQEQTAKSAINFLLYVQKKRKDIVTKKLDTLWLGTKYSIGILQEIRNKYLRNL